MAVFSVFPRCQGWSLHDLSSEFLHVKTHNLNVVVGGEGDVGIRVKLWGKARRARQLSGEGLHCRLDVSSHLFALEKLPKVSTIKLGRAHL